VTATAFAASTSNVTVAIVNSILYLGGNHLLGRFGIGPSVIDIRMLLAA
jgi:hypothetical protein